MLLPGRHGEENTAEYRYGFQGQEDDPEIKGKGNSTNYKYRMHDPRIGRFFAVDPLSPEYPELTPYQFSSNSPIYMVELEGLEGVISTGAAHGAGAPSGSIGIMADPNGWTGHRVQRETFGPLESQAAYDNATRGVVNIAEAVVVGTKKRNIDAGIYEIGDVGVYGGVIFSAKNGTVFEQITRNTVIAYSSSGPGAPGTMLPEYRFIPPQDMGQQHGFGSDGLIYNARCLICHSPAGAWNYAAYNSREKIVGGLFGQLLGEVATGGVMSLPSLGGVNSLLAKSSRTTMTKALTNKELVQKSAELAERQIGGIGGVAGTAKHQYSNALLKRYQSLYGNRGLRTNVYFNNGPGNRGFLDVLDETNGIIYDFKFGSATMGTAQFEKYSRNFGLPIEIIKP